METRDTRTFQETHPQTFYPTYEEWKLLLIYLFTVQIYLFILPMRNGNITAREKLEKDQEAFYPTYEEWKLISIAAFISSIETFYPTYEEWKRL